MKLLKESTETSIPKRRKKMENEIKDECLLEGTGEEVCSFCGKKAKEVEWLIAGPNSYICSECVEVCNNIIADYRL